MSGWYFVVQAGFILMIAFVTFNTNKNTRKIHVLVNSAMLAQKKTLAEVTAAKWVITDTISRNNLGNVDLLAQADLDKRQADSAMADYLNCVKNQARASKL